jgi:hypothetical protein
VWSFAISQVPYYCAYAPISGPDYWTIKVNVTHAGSPPDIEVIRTNVLADYWVSWSETNLMVFDVQANSDNNSANSIWSVTWNSNADHDFLPYADLHFNDTLNGTHLELGTNLTIYLDDDSNINETPPQETGRTPLLLGSSLPTNAYFTIWGPASIIHQLYLYISIPSGTPEGTYLGQVHFGYRIS